MSSNLIVNINEPSNKLLSNNDEHKTLMKEDINKNSDNQLRSDIDNNELDDSLPLARFKRYNSKRWILALICLCLILMIALIGCYVSYKRCCYDTNTKAPCKSALQVGDDEEANKFSHDNLKSSDASENVVFVEKLTKNWNSSRLPSNLKPYFYKIDLRIDVYNKSFSGNCSIKFTCLSSISFLVLHSETNIVFDGKDYLPKIYENRGELKYGRELKVKQLTYNAFFSYVIIELEDGEYFRKNNNYTVLVVNYFSQIKNDLKGIYYGTCSTKNETK